MAANSGLQTGRAASGENKEGKWRRGGEKSLEVAEQTFGAGMRKSDVVGSAAFGVMGRRTSGEIDDVEVWRSFHGFLRWVGGSGELWIVCPRNKPDRPTRPQCRGRESLQP